MLIYISMVLGAVSIVCVGLTARRLAADELSLGAPALALVTAFTAVALMLTSTALGN